MDATDCWYGFIYTLNNSKYELKEKLSPKLEGCEAIWPVQQGKGGSFELNLKPGEEHIIVLRRT